MKVEWLEHPGEDDLRPTARLVSDFWHEVIPGEPDITAGELAAEVREAPAHRRVLTAAAFDGVEQVGVSRLVLEDLVGVDSIGWIQYLIVGHDHRRRGVAKALLAAIGRRANQEGRIRITNYVAQSQTAGTSLARAAGAEAGLVQYQNRLRTAAMDRALLNDWVSQASQRASGYSLVCFDGICPDEWLERFAAVISVMNTAPRNIGVSDTALTGDQVRAQEEAHLRRGGWGWTVCALHRGSGQLVGFTELGGDGYRPWLAVQGDTGVSPEHRNLGLGRWIKATNALRLLDEKPAISTIETWNADVNKPMLSINDAMGFEVAATWQEWALQVRDRPSTY